jgi:hypothetical protein
MGGFNFFDMFSVSATVQLGGSKDKGAPDIT